MITRHTYKEISVDQKNYINSRGYQVSFWVEKDEDEPSESCLYRIQSNGKTLSQERLSGNEWSYAPLFYSLQFDSLLEHITLEEAERIAEQIGEKLVD